MSIEPAAGLTQLRYGATVRRYEQIKLAATALALVVNLAIGGYLVTIARSNKVALNTASQSLVILRCAVDKSTSVDASGKPRTAAEQRVAFDHCVAVGGPANLRP